MTSAEDKDIRQSGRWGTLVRLRQADRLGSLARSVVRRLQEQLRRQGVDVRRWQPAHDPYYRRSRLLTMAGVTAVIDVGANAGQFGLELRRLGYCGRIISFEPLAEAYARLSSIADADPLWEVWNLGMGDQPGEFAINIASNSQSSSLLPMTSHHLSAAPHARYVSKEKVTLETLDRFFRTRDALGAVPYLKIDAQGYEHRILAGASDLLDRMAGLQLELSLVPMYTGETLFPDMLTNVYERGFRIASIENGLMDPRTGQQLQVDVVFFRHEHLARMRSVPRPTS